MEHRVNFYTKEGCPLCEKGLAIMKDIQQEYSFQMEEVDIYQNDELLEKYQIMIPVVEINGKEVDYGLIDRNKVTEYFQMQRK